MERGKKLPVGIENFEKIRTEDFYYVDKTSMIRELLNNWGEVNLFTRPRRFGKSLNMSMLKCFFEYGCNERIFEGLEIAGEQELCRKYMGQFPVISISLKDVGFKSYPAAREMLCSIIGNEALRFSFLLESETLSKGEREQYKQLAAVGEGGGPAFVMTEEVLAGSLLTLSKLLCRHYGKKVILLLDEYDVPLDKAQQGGYYDEMLDLIRKLFSRVLKSNENLYFAVLTGCLRISKESVFTGLNNLKEHSIADVRYDDQFGFSDREVRALLTYYGLEDRYETVRDWYDGYRFGKAEVYCPWDVISYADLLCSDSTAEPKAFWLNTSGNDIIRKFIRTAGPKTKRELEQLMDGGTVTKKINQEMTYRYLYLDTDHLWSLLFLTGYLTRRGDAAGGFCQMAIPNREIRTIFAEQIMEWFEEETGKDFVISL